MPIENELKFVLHDPAGALERALATQPGASAALLRQAYLESAGVRIREIADAAGRRAVFTFKRTIDGEVVEIETALSAADFARLWSTRRETLVKRRYHLPAGDCAWDIDFFKDGDDAGSPTFFALAEVEMPEGRVVAPAPPGVLAPYVIHAVEQGDERYTSKRLSSVEHARGLMATLRPGRRP